MNTRHLPSVTDLLPGQSPRVALDAGAALMGLEGRVRVVSPALRAYALMATSADTGAVRDVDAVEAAVAAARVPADVLA